jgi:hypothetical protein
MCSSKMPVPICQTGLVIFLLRMVLEFWGLHSSGCYDSGLVGCVQAAWMSRVNTQWMTWSVKKIMWQPEISKCKFSHSSLYCSKGFNTIYLYVMLFIRITGIQKPTCFRIIYCITITILNVIHRPVFGLKLSISEIVFCLCLQVKPTAGVQRQGLALSIWLNWVCSSWRRRQNPVSETSYFK